MNRIKKYNTEEERKAAQKEAIKRWWAAHPSYWAEYYQNNKEKLAEYRQNNKEKKAKYNTEYYQNNKEKIAKKQAEYHVEYQSTPKGRAVNLVGTYKQEDNKYNRGECTLTADWIIEHIFTQPCAHCGKTGWKIIGCNRLDNSLPHTPDNVEPCCAECNKKLPRQKNGKHH